LVVVGRDFNIEAHGQGWCREFTPTVTVCKGEGHAKIKGERMTVFFTGSSNFTATGRGAVVLKGDWDYDASGWNPILPIAEVEALEAP